MKWQLFRSRKASTDKLVKNIRWKWPVPLKILHKIVESARLKGFTMKRRFTDEQIIMMLKEQESGLPTKQVCRKHGISEASFFKYKSKYGGMELSDAKKLKALEEENNRLKKMVADLMLDNTMLKDITSKKCWRLMKGGALSLTFAINTRWASVGRVQP